MLCYLIITLFSYQSDSLIIDNSLFIKHQLKIGNGQSSFAVADFNQDKHVDIAIANLNDENVQIFIGDGKGTLTFGNQYNSGKAPSDITNFDINNDGFSDLIIANHETSYVTFLNGDGNGNFKQSSNSPYHVDVDPHPHMALLMDMNGDNHPDLIVDHRARKGLLIRLGLGNNAFEKRGKIIDVGGDPYRGFSIADINNDGQLDIVTPNSNELSIVLNQSEKQLKFSPYKTIRSETPFATSLTDMNGDGNLDLISASNGSSISIYWGDRTGSFSEKSTRFKMSAGAKQLSNGDIDGDGFNDALISCWNNELMIVLGGKELGKSIRFTIPEIPNPWGIELVDLNDDGKDDLLITDGSNDHLIIYLSSSHLF